MRKEKKLCLETNLPGVFLVLYREGNINGSFRKGQNLEGFNFRFTIEGRDGRPITADEVRSRGRLNDARNRLTLMLSEAFGVGVVKFADSGGKNSKCGIFVSGEFLKNEFPVGWLRVHPSGH